MPWQFGALGLTEDGGNRIIKYADALNHGVSAIRSLLHCMLACAEQLPFLQASPNDGNPYSLW